MGVRIPPLPPAPAEKILMAIKKNTKLLNIDEAINEIVLGQSHATSRIVPFIKTYKTGMAPTDKPAGSFILLGPTGTGKTYTPEAIAQVLHKDPEKIVLINLGEYTEDSSVNRLLGAPPGYIGHNIPPVITDKVLKSNTSSYCDLSIVVFDEFEKAAPSVERVLLNILSKGKLTIGDGTTVDFTKSLIFLTSNIGSSKVAETNNFGFLEKSKHVDIQKLETSSISALKKKYSPEFLGRLNDILVYYPLSDPIISSITEMEIERNAKKFRTKNINLVVSKNAKELIKCKSSGPSFGAREITGIIFKNIVHPVAVMLYDEKLIAGDIVNITASANNKFLIKVAKRHKFKVKIS